MEKNEVLSQDFFSRPALVVARELLGKHLVRGHTGETEALMITETEAYIGPEDKACHAYKGRTKRTEVMFGPSGRWYVYFIYGMYDMLNVVTERDGFPAAVLIRGLESVTGPGRLTKKLGITRTLNGALISPSSGLWIEDRKNIVQRSHIKTTPRIGIAYAGEWIEKPYRFVYTP